ncbi:uncharacterized protein LOC132727472 [Ruditapes philippinarum]|uniref:uncharacterized protein LOC132727472 n=1 Tax=Ruditapes philippinarum TaxID=129788 RepID=UPI00295B779E|nr:uncharacterized protein LOC132727472 [Ruditapes philippinarum]
MPFGLSNAPATFERLIELVLRGMQWKKCLCYLDDIIVFGPDFESTLENLKQVFVRFRAANLKLKPKKCHLFKKQVHYLGHIVSEEGISCNPDKIQSIKGWPVPTNKSEVKSFLGLASYYRKFISGHANLTFHLNELTQKKKKFIWTEDCQESFDKLKEKLTSPPVLAFPQENGLFILDTDGCNTSIGCVLSQEQNGEEKVISYASKSLSKSQQRYCTTFIELLAVVTFVKYFRHYLWGRKFLIRTDHASLIWLKNFKEPEGMLARWLAVLDTYDFTIQYRKGSLHTNADALSRIPIRKRTCKRTNCPDCGLQNPNIDCSVQSSNTCHRVQVNQNCIVPIENLAKSVKISDNSVQNMNTVYSVHNSSTGHCIKNINKDASVLQDNTVFSVQKAHTKYEENNTQYDVQCSDTEFGQDLQNMFCIFEASNDTQLSSTDSHKESNGFSSQSSIQKFTFNDKNSEVPIHTLNVESDGNAQNQSLAENQIPVMNSNWIGQWSNKELLEFQKQDPDIRIILDFKLKSKDKPSKHIIAQYNTNVRTFWTLWESLIVKNNLLWREHENQTLRLVLPQKLRTDVFNHLHTNRIAGHLGRDRTIASIKKRFYWPNFTSDIKRWVQSCDMCARRKPGPGCGKSHIQQEISYQPLDRIALDILGPLPCTSDGNQYIVVISDYFTKYVEETILLLR